MAMKIRITLLLTALVLLTCSCINSRYEQRHSSKAEGIKTNYDPDAILSASELQTVIKLASQCGITDIGEVYTFNIHPSPSFGIGVKSVETMNGREVSFSRIFVDCDKWVKPGNSSRDVVKSAGRFWVRRDTMETITLTTFAVPGGSTRIRLPETVSLSTADRIFDALAAGRIRYRDEKLKEEFKGISLVKAQALFPLADGGMFCVDFSTGPLSSISFYFTLQADGITILDVHRGAL